MKFQQGEVPST